MQQSVLDLNPDIGKNWEHKTQNECKQTQKTNHNTENKNDEQHIHQVGGASQME
jgi:hypothetical protein